MTGSAALFGDGPAIARRIKDEVRDEVGLTASVGVATHQARGQDRVGPAQARRAGRRAAGRGGGLPRAAADRAAVGRRREDRGRARRVRRADDRRPGGAAAGPPRPPVRQARRVARRRARAGSTPTRSTTATRRSRSATSTRSTSTRATRRSSSGRCWRWPTASPAGCARPASGRGRSRSRSATAAFRTITRQRTLAEPTDLTEPIYATALDLARPEIRGMRVRLLGRHAPRTSASASSSALFEHDDPRRRRAVEAADALRRRYGERTR